jgi:hypothetical protein
MMIKSRTFIAAASALLLFAVPAAASAIRVYFLVGTRHVYRIGTDKYFRYQARQATEQDYADSVSMEADAYNQTLAYGANPDAASFAFDHALEQLARNRDDDLSRIYQVADYEFDQHPELRVEGDGPYQVIGIDYHNRGTVEVFDSYVVYDPWPGYVARERPYGWSVGVTYTPTTFVNVYVNWHTQYVQTGRPAFVGFNGHSGPVHVDGFARGANGRLSLPRGNGNPSRNPPVMRNDATHEPTTSVRAVPTEPGTPAPIQRGRRRGGKNGGPAEKPVNVTTDGAAPETSTATPPAIEAKTTGAKRGGKAAAGKKTAKGGHAAKKGKKKG